MIAERAHRRKLFILASYHSWAAVIILALLYACSFSPPKEVSRAFLSNSATKSPGFTNFETEPVHPLALSADGRYLYALNTADDRLEIFDAQGETLRSLGETTVGLVRWHWRSVAMTYGSSTIFLTRSA